MTIRNILRTLVLVCICNTHVTITHAQTLFVDGFEVLVGKWNPSRNSDGFIEADIGGGYGSVEFRSDVTHQDITTGFPIGHGLPKVANRIFYDLRLDGYGGLPPGSCPGRGYLMDTNDPSQPICQANENEDLLRIWAGRNPDLQHVLVKNVEVKNAFRTYNVVDGTVVENSSSLPHTDTFQSFFGNGEEDPEWLVIQDSIIKNSDNNLMILGSTKFKGFLYQNLTTDCEDWFVEDDYQRSLNDNIAFNTGNDGRRLSCANQMGASSSEAATVWLIDVENSVERVQITNQNAPVIVVGINADSLSIRTRDADRRFIDHPHVYRYLHVEDALVEHSEPPFVRLSCAGWRTRPANCESRQGYIEQR